MAQVIEHLSSKFKALCKKKKRNLLFCSVLGLLTQTSLQMLVIDVCSRHLYFTSLVLC
jgi:hypothetical protein